MKFKTTKMKTPKLIVLALFLFASTANHAQVSISVNVGTPPVWGPVVHTDASYYYMPDVESYYDIRQQQFIFLSNGVWIRSHNLPYRYRNYNLHNGRTIVLNDYHGSSPYTHYKEHKVKYYQENNNGHQHNYRTADNYKPHNNGNDNRHENENKHDNGNKGHGNEHGHGKH